MTIPYDIFPAIMKVIDYVGKGYTVTRACSLSNISYTTLRNYLRTSSEFQAMFTDAEQQGHDIMAEALLDPKGHHEYGTADAKEQKVMSDNIKWFLARKRPSVYGDRVLVSHEITLDRAITSALEAGKQRALTAVRGDAIDVEYTVVPPREEAKEEIDPLAQFIG